MKKSTAHPPVAVAVAVEPTSMEAGAVDAAAPRAGAVADLRASRAGVAAAISTLAAGEAVAVGHPCPQADPVDHRRHLKAATAVAVAAAPREEGSEDDLVPPA
jgi:hypothetical protein